MKRTILFGLAVLALSVAAEASEGMIHLKSAFGVVETGDRLEKAVQKKGMTVFNRIRHSESAGKVGVNIRATELLVFGNPKVGSPLMKCSQKVAIDLPQKALIWMDEDSNVWISYNDPRYLEKRHAISGCEEVLMKIEKALRALTKAAATK